LKFRHDNDRIVAESCEVALDIMQSEISGEFVPLVVEPPRAAA
jgi:deoxyhypusine monooxygenase